MALRIRTPLAGLLVLLLVVLLPAAAAAHEHRQVGPYEIVVGWDNEPAFAGEKNGLDLRVFRQETQAPVEGLEQSLTVRVIFGAQERVLELRPAFRQPGHYTADLAPTRDGDYRFHIAGTIEGNPIEETFDSADGKFNGVNPMTAIQFPDVLPAAGEAVQAASAADQRAAAAGSTAQGAQTLALIASVLGGLALLVAVMALVRGARRDSASPQVVPESRPASTGGD